MQIVTWSAQTRSTRPVAPWRAWADSAASLSAVVALAVHMMMAASTPEVPATAAATEPATAASAPGREILIAGYVSQPFYQRSDVHMTRPDATDVKLKALGWDGDALMFPIDGGIRSMEWWGSAGLMVDFLHNKAVARLGKGAHGRKIKNGIIEDVATEGTLAGKPAPSPVKLTDVFERLEFTHGHNVLIFTGLLRPPAFSPRIRPYFGLGAGFALPHVEVWFPGGARDDRTSEYQYAGPAAQAVAGLEIRTGKVSYFLEYKLSWAHIAAAITGDESWMDFLLPGDLLRQAGRWWRGEEPRLGRIETTLVAQQAAFGAGYWWQARRPLAP